MSHILISTVEETSGSTFEKTFGFTMDYEQEFQSSDFIGKENILEILISTGYLIKNDDTKPLKPKGIGIYELKSYPNNRFIFKDGNVYKSNTITSNTWNPLEWDIIVQGN